MTLRTGVDPHPNYKDQELGRVDQTWEMDPAEKKAHAHISNT